MKLKKLDTLLIVLILIAIAIGIFILYQIPSINSKYVELKMTVNNWSWGTGKNESSTIRVKEGEDFGRTDYIGSQKAKPFKLLKIIDENNIKVSYNEMFFVVGESMDESTHPQIISLEETCFRTRSFDSGTDVCLKIIK